MSHQTAPKHLHWQAACNSNPGDRNHWVTSRGTQRRQLTSLSRLNFPALAEGNNLYLYSNLRPRKLNPHQLEGNWSLLCEPFPEAEEWTKWGFTTLARGCLHPRKLPTDSYRKCKRKQAGRVNASLTVPRVKRESSDFSLCLLALCQSGALHSSDLKQVFSRW